MYVHGVAYFLSVCLVLGALTALGCLSGALTPTRYMTSLCQTRSLHVNSSLILELTRDFENDRFLVDYLQCSVDVTVDSGFRVYVHFLSLDISDHANTPDRLHIYDFARGAFVRVTPPTGLYGVVEQPFYNLHPGSVLMKDYTSSSSTLRLDYLGKPTHLYQGFAILLTAYRPTTSVGLCEDGYFHCAASQVCVPQALVCDSQPNCGQADPSDEKQCAAHAETVTTLQDSYSVLHAVAAGIVASAVFLLAAAVVGLFVLRYNRKRDSHGDLRVLISRNADGVCTITSDLDNRLYAPPSYEDVISSSKLDPPPEYGSITPPGHRLADSDSEDGSLSDCPIPPLGRQVSVPVKRLGVHANSTHLRSSPSDPTFDVYEDAVVLSSADVTSVTCKGKGKACSRGRVKSSSCGTSPFKDPPSAEGISSLPAAAKASCTSQESGVVADLGDSSCSENRGQSSPGTVSLASSGRSSIGDRRPELLKLSGGQDLPKTAVEAPGLQAV